MAPNRITKINVQAEYKPIHKNRVTKINVQAEYKPIHKNRVTKLVVQVEYSPKPARVRIYGPAIQ